MSNTDSTNNRWQKVRSKLKPVGIAGLVLLSVMGLTALGFLGGYWSSPKIDKAIEKKLDALDVASSPSTDTTSNTNTETEAPDNTGNPESNANPDLNVDSQGLSRATVEIQTERGKIRFKFYTHDAPNTIKRIIELINSGFYNGLKFHRVVPGFVVQGGDPIGDGTGGSGQKLSAEFNGRKHVEGAIAMARAADPDSADSQFYISLGNHPHLDGKYTVFGQVTYGLDVVRKIKVGDRMKSVVIK